MRVAVCVDPLDGIGSRAAGTAIARAFAALGDQCAVVPIGRSGAGAAEALADLFEADELTLPAQPGSAGPRARAWVASAGVPAGTAVLQVQAAPDAPADPVHEPSHDPSHAPAGEGSPVFGGTSEPVGHALRDLLGVRPDLRRVFLDPGPVRWHDGGAGLLLALGATADAGTAGGVHDLAMLHRLDPTAARRLLHGVEVVLLAPEGQERLPLSGLRGITSVVGHDRGADLALMLEVDHLLSGLARAAGAPELANQPGAGAAGGLGFAVLLLGGRVRTGIEACRQASGLDRALERADLVVVGCDQLDAGHWEASSVLALSALVDARVPVVAVARRARVAQRELRLHGIEEAHSLARTDDEPLTPGLVTARMAAVAASWHVG